MAIAYALLAASSWGLADFLAGVKSRRLGVITVLLWVEAAGLAAIMVVIVAVSEPLPGTRSVVAAVIAGAAGFTALGAFYKALSIGTMSIVAPISASGAALPVIVGLASGDSLKAIVGAGLVIIVVGVMVASREEVGEVERGGANRVAVLLALGTAVGFGLYFTFADIAADGSVLWLLAIGRIVILPAVLVFALRRRVPIVPPPRDRWQLVCIGLFDLSATGLYGVATTHGELSIVAVVGSLYPVATVLLAWGFLHERISRSQLAGVVAAMAGVAMVSAG